MGDEVVWDWPRDFIDDPNESDSWGHTVGDTTWHNFHLKNLHSFLRLYIDTPRADLDDFSKEYCGLRDLLRAADKRRGRHANAILMFSTDSARARKVIHYRYGRKQREA
ncbi:MAG: hypothetical protein DI537_60920 [Stutzerimonas stutzeri]|nr:MAG: hypothetical protein DI537_60920 [Stutzerimonas stutzeri]